MTRRAWRAAFTGVGLLMCVLLCVGGQGCPEHEEGELSVSMAALSFGADTSTQTFTIRNTGLGPLTWQAEGMHSWVSLQPSSGALGAGESRAVTVTIQRAGLNAGTHSSSVRITSDGGSASVSLAVVVGDPPDESPELAVSPASLSFTESSGAAQINVSNSGGGSLQWEVSSAATWLSVTPSSGSGQRTLSVSVNATALAVGTTKSTLRVTSNGGDADVPVTVVVGSGGANLVIQ